jgi:hypothetical protein
LYFVTRKLSVSFVRFRAPLHLGHRVSQVSLIAFMINGSPSNSIC